MKLTLVKSKYEPVILGALNGLLIGFIVNLATSQYESYMRGLLDEEFYRKWGVDAPTMVAPPHDLVRTTLAFAVIFAFSSFIVYRIAPSFRKKPTSLWLIIGLLSITTWNVVVLSIFSLDKFFSGSPGFLERLTSFETFLYGPTSFLVVISFNLLYGLAVKLISKVVQHQVVTT